MALVGGTPVAFSQGGVFASGFRSWLGSGTAFFQRMVILPGLNDFNNRVRPLDPGSTRFGRNYDTPNGKQQPLAFVTQSFGGAVSVAVAPVALGASAEETFPASVSVATAPLAVSAASALSFVAAASAAAAPVAMTASASYIDTFYAVVSTSVAPVAFDASARLSFMATVAVALPGAAASLAGSSILYIWCPSMATAVEGYTVAASAAEDHVLAATSVDAHTTAASVAGCDC